MDRITLALLAIGCLTVLDARAQFDICVGAPVVTCGSVVTGNTSAFTADVAPFCVIGDGTAAGVWYRFAGNGQTVTASLCGSSYDTAIRIFSGPCGTPTCVTGNDDLCGSQSQVSWASVNGLNYRILVYGFGANVGQYTLSITCASPMCYSTTLTPFVLDPHAGSILTLTDDIHSGVVNIGFSFCYDGVSYSQCVISSNNYITFNLANAGTFSDYNIIPVPSTTPVGIRNSILAPWQDTYPPACAVGSNCIRHQTLGVAPNRRFVVSYQNVPMFQCTQLVFTSQIVLYEGSNCIGNFIQNKPICAGWQGGKAVQALQNLGGTGAFIVTGRNNTQWIANNEGRYFTPTCAPCSTAVTATCVVPTPIELLHFTGRADGSANVLEWATASEENTDHFTVERSEDGEEFTPLLTVPAAGSSHAMITYLERDAAPFRGVNYYRLRATDADGSDELSHVIAVNSDQQNGILIYPNPVEGAAAYRLPDGLPLPAVLILRDLAGRPVKRLEVQLLEGTLDVRGLAAGSYLLELLTTGASTGTRLVVE